MAALTIQDIKTVEFSRPPLDLGEVLDKFQGKRTSRTLAAARRMRAAKHTVKLPRNLLRQLFRVTGGWQNPLKEGWNNTTPDTGWKVLQVGDLELIIQNQSGGNNFYNGLLRYRGLPVARIDSYWNDQAKLRGAVQALGVAFTK